MFFYHAISLLTDSIQTPKTVFLFSACHVDWGTLPSDSIGLFRVLLAVTVTAIQKEKMAEVSK